MITVLFAMGLWIKSVWNNLSSRCDEYSKDTNGIAFYR